MFSHFKRMFLQGGFVINFCHDFRLFKNLRLRRDIEFIKSEGKFDELFYKACATHKQIQVSGCPIKHYLQQGIQKGLDPEPKFDSEFYLSVNKDVCNANLNPYLHYLRFGKQEGRKPYKIVRTKRWEKSVIDINFSSLKKTNPRVYTEIADYIVYQIGAFKKFSGACELWTISPYKKCSHRCIYCSVNTQGKSRVYLTKKEILDSVKSFSIYGAGEPVVLGAYVDIYPPEEINIGRSRLLVKAVTEHKIPFVIITKGVAVKRDIDLFENNPYLRQLAFSISSHEESYYKKFEPGVSTLAERLEIMAEMAEKNIPVTVHIQPWIPGITDVEKIISLIPEGTPVHVSALLLGDHIQDLHLGVTGKLPSALKVFGNDFIDQKKVDEEYLQEYHKLKGKIPNPIEWRFPQMQAETIYDYMDA